MSSKSALNFARSLFFFSRLVLGLQPSSLSPPKISAPCRTFIHLPSRRMWTMAFPTGCTEPTPTSLKLSRPLPLLPHPPVMELRHPLVTRYLNILIITLSLDPVSMNQCPCLVITSAKEVAIVHLSRHLPIRIPRKPFHRLRLNLVES